MIVYTDDAAREVARAIDELKADRTFILSDTNVFAALREMARGDGCAFGSCGRVIEVD